MTFSLVGRCERSGSFGVIVSSSSPAVAARCAHARAGVGAAASQNVTDPRLGTRMLDAMAAGATAAEAVADASAQPHAAWRQLSALDARGTSATFSGAESLGTHATAQGRDCAAAGNLLASVEVVAAMVAAFEASLADDLGDRLLAAAYAALAARGEVGPVRSVGMLVVEDVAWPTTDLRVDWHDDPIGELAAIWQVWKPQAPEYRQRGLDPDASPGYGVPGDER